jgi:mannose/cellobiose epimerase-like protein (N-acyl-D-glucosamine 2-epimerase family)
LKSGRVYGKSYNSTIYVATSALLALHRTFPNNKLYKERVETLSYLITSHFWDKKTGWLVEEFTDDWREGWEHKKRGELTLSEVGHTAQVAWLLLRISQTVTLPVKTRNTALKLAKHILKTFLQKPVHDPEHGGVYGLFTRENSKEAGNGTKSWWQQAETVLAFQMAKKLKLIDQDAYDRMVRSNVAFFFRTFVDQKAGGEFFNVSRDGKPIPNEPKGNKGKSAYHTVELAKYMIKYQK